MVGVLNPWAAEAAERQRDSPIDVVELPPDAKSVKRASYGDPTASGERNDKIRE